MITSLDHNTMLTAMCYRPQVQAQKAGELLMDLQASQIYSPHAKHTCST